MCSPRTRPCCVSPVRKDFASSGIPRAQSCAAWYSNSVDLLSPRSLAALGRRGRNRTPPFLAFGDVRIVGLRRFAVIPGGARRRRGASRGLRRRSLGSPRLVHTWGRLSHGIPAGSLYVIHVVRV